ncbi:NUDIX hydrolase [Kitasatospora purpeofusca]|uniref:NUDIX hydrolase n=1 Tax=Kitasatospora purpeofusca TaxID=67352 RepID=UPI00340F36E4
MPHHHALILNRDGAVLLIATTRTPGLTLPGGPAETDELPHHAARRHTETQTGLVLPLLRILATDHTDTHPQTLHLVHWGGRLNPAQESTTTRHRPPHTVTGVHWIHHTRLADAMHPDHHRRTIHALDALTRGTHLPLLLRGTPAE